MSQVSGSVNDNINQIIPLRIRFRGIKKQIGTAKMRIFVCVCVMCDDKACFQNLIHSNQGLGYLE